MSNDSVAARNLLARDLQRIGDALEEVKDVLEALTDDVAALMWSVGEAKGTLGNLEVES
jgi:hypothetical protein